MKSLLTGYLLWFFFAAHYAYFGRWRAQAALWFFVAAFWVGLYLGLNVGQGYLKIAIIGGIVAGLWQFVDLFRMPHLIEKVNQKQKNRYRAEDRNSG